MRLVRLQGGTIEQRSFTNVELQMNQALEALAPPT